jgi:hypothetical protein
MIGVIIGIILIAFGFMTNSWLLIFLGIAAGLIFTALNRPAKIEYIEVEAEPGQKPKHMVIAPPPPQQHYPLPQEMQAPFGKQIYQQGIKVEVKKFEKQLKKKGKSPLEIKKAVKEFKKDVAKGKKLTMADTFPYFRPYPKHPGASLLMGLPIALFRKTFGKEDDIK